MGSTITSPRLSLIFSRENLVIRDEWIQDKPLVLHAIANLFGDHQMPYVIVGAFAVQVHCSHSRPTDDIDLVTSCESFARLQSTEEWRRYGFRYKAGRRQIVTLRHDEGNVNVDVILDRRFAQTLDDPHEEVLDGRPILFCSAEKLAFSKLRTQQKNWSRDPGKRMQDRVHLIELLQEHPELVEAVKQEPMTTPEMRQIMEEDFSSLGPYIEDDILLLPEDGSEDSDVD